MSPSDRLKLYLQCLSVRHIQCAQKAFGKAFFCSLCARNINSASCSVAPCTLRAPLMLLNVAFRSAAQYGSFFLWLFSFVRILFMNSCSLNNLLPCYGGSCCVKIGLHSWHSYFPSHHKYTTRVMDLAIPVKGFLLLHRTVVIAACLSYNHKFVSFTLINLHFIYNALL